MIVTEFGIKNKEIIVLFHGGGLSWWNYMDEIELLKNQFHVLLPALDGHSGSDADFTSIEDNAARIIRSLIKPSMSLSYGLIQKNGFQSCK